METIQQRLANIDYSFDNYKPSLDALMFSEFIKEVNKSSGGEEHQTPIVHLKMLDLIFDKKCNRKAIMCSRGLAKALEVNTPILTPNGYVPMKHIKVGDTVYDRNGEKTKVTHKSGTFRNKCYQFVLSTGDTFIANEDHLHIVKHRTAKRENGRTINYVKEEVLSTKELLKRNLKTKRIITAKTTKEFEYLYFFPEMTTPIKFNENYKPEIDPYTIGYILGDGTIPEDGNVTITCDKKDIKEVMSYIPYKCIRKNYNRLASPNTNCFSFLDNFHYLARTYISSNKRDDKYIPHQLLYGSIHDRLELLRGLMDSDGTVSSGKNYCSFCNISRYLAYGVHHLVRSLGGFSTIKHYKNDYKGYYIVSFNLNTMCPFKLKRKANIWEGNLDKAINRRIMIHDIIELWGEYESQCISVDSPTKSYLIENCIITHNTTLSSEYGFLYAACFNKYLGLDNVNIAMYVASSLEKGAKDLRRNIEQRYANSEFLQKMIPNKKFSATDTTSKHQMPLSENDINDIANAGRNITDVRIEFVNINKQPFCIRLFGVTSGIRGFKEYGKRCPIAIADDIISDSDARSDAVIKSVEETIYKAVTYALHPTNNQILFIGTPFNSKDPLYKAIESDGWKSVVFPIAEKFPCEPHEFKGAWEDRFPYRVIKQMYDSSVAGGTEQAFRQEMMLQIIPEEGLLVPRDKIIEIPSDTFKQKNHSCYNFYITTDFAYTDKESSDYSVISVWAINNNGDYILCDGYCGKALIDHNINKLFEFCSKYKPLQVGFEVTGQQIGFVNLIRNEMVKRNSFFFIKEIRPAKDKFSRFNHATPLFHQGKILILSNMMKSSWGVEFTDEISKATIEGFKSKHDDVLDTISQLIDLEVFIPDAYELDEEGERIETAFDDDPRSSLIF